MRQQYQFAKSGNNDFDTKINEFENYANQIFIKAPGLIEERKYVKCDRFIDLLANVLHRISTISSNAPPRYLKNIDAMKRFKFFLKDVIDIIEKVLNCPLGEEKIVVLRKTKNLFIKFFKIVSAQLRDIVVFEPAKFPEPPASPPDNESIPSEESIEKEGCCEKYCGCKCTIL